jgi:hypothetical protein
MLSFFRTAWLQALGTGIGRLSNHANTFAPSNKIKPWPASEESLGRWISIRASGTDSPLLGQGKPDTIQGYLSALRSRHVDLGLPTDVFDSEHLRRLLKGAKRLYNRPVLERRLITRDILSRLTSPSLPGPRTGISDINALNFDTAFKVAFAGFFRLGRCGTPLRFRIPR